MGGDEATARTSSRSRRPRPLRMQPFRKSIGWVKPNSRSDAGLSTTGRSVSWQVTDSLASEVEPGRLRIGNKWVKADVILWATGVAASPLVRQLRAPLDRSGRVQVQPDLIVLGHPEVFVVGDMASLTDVTGRNVPGLAAAAIQEGRTAADNMLQDIRGRTRRAFVYRDRGIMATIGLHRAVAEFGRRLLRTACMALVVSGPRFRADWVSQLGDRDGKVDLGLLDALGCQSAHHRISGTYPYKESLRNGSRGGAIPRWRRRSALT